jgi:tetratricopeptide (TPR) repeat protein
VNAVPGSPRRDDPATVARYALEALDNAGEAEALPLVEAAAERIGDDALLWQCTGLLRRALGEHALALSAFERAASLAPADAKIAQGRAQVALEAGCDAVALFEQARALNPGDGSVHLGLTAARFAEADAAGAINELDALLVQNPAWIEGHVTLARLRAMMGEQGGAMASFERALAAQPRNINLWQSFVRTLIEGEHHAAALAALHRGRAALQDSMFLAADEASLLSEVGDIAGADSIFGRMPDNDDEATAVRRLRHVLRAGRLAPALRIIDAWARRSDATAIWPYAGLVWRIADDPRQHWLDRGEQMVSVIDLADRLPDLEGLAARLRALHLARAQPLDQSVRGGTQTDGHLLLRIEPEIRALRAALVAAVEAHIAQLPPIDPAHPTLGHRRDRPVRFAGAWSVRLSGAGHHSNHVHPAGWFSSALYVAVPEEAERGPGDAGWLVLGEPPAGLGLDLPPTRRIEPRPGRLVLFPSIMWHGTRPFAAGERLTVAFDIAPPR